MSRLYQYTPHTEERENTTSTQRKIACLLSQEFEKDVTNVILQTDTHPRLQRVRT
jgi:hypothetical protein